MIDTFTENKIKESAAIVDVVSDFLELKRKGANYETLCPFHNDRHLGSFVVSPRHNCYKCFSCDAGGGPVDFLMNYAKLSYPSALRYLAQKYGIPMDDDGGKQFFESARPAKPRSIADAIPPNLPPKIWPAYWPNYYTDLSQDNLVAWMRSQPWDDCQRRRLDEVLREYRVGHTTIEWYQEKVDFTLFWQIDHNGQLHNAHLMKYKPDGHRDKESNYTQTWLHARMRHSAKNHFDDMKNSASYCLYGLHLMDTYPTARVHIVESEKTALIMATAYGNNAEQVWMACGGMENLSPERLSPLIRTGRSIELFPDHDGIKAWKEKAVDLGYKDLTVNTHVVKKWWTPQDGEKADIADIVLRYMSESNPPVTTLKQAIEQNPAIGLLHEKMKLKVTNNQ